MAPFLARQYQFFNQLGSKIWQGQYYFDYSTFLPSKPFTIKANLWLIFPTPCFLQFGLKNRENKHSFQDANPFSNNFDLKPFPGAGYISKGLAVELIILVEHIYDSAPLKPVLKFAVQCHY